MAANEFKICPAGLELYRRYWLTMEIGCGILTYEARQGYRLAWMDHKNKCPMCSGLKGTVK
ncbi:MAG: hypothetical protein ACYDGL_00810 [Bellilinea sp.]